MQAPPDLSTCSEVARRGYDCLLKISKGTSIRTSTLMEKLGQRLGVDQIEVKGIVRELHRAGLLQYTADRQELPVTGMVEIVRPEKSVSQVEVLWTDALAQSRLSANAREALQPFFCKVGDLSAQDMVCLADCFAALESVEGIDLNDAGFNVSARTLMGGSKVLTQLDTKMLQAIGLPARLKTSSPRYVVCAGPSQPTATLLIENPRAFENAVRSGLSETVALVCTYGFGLSYLGQVWREEIHTEDQPIQIVRAGTPGSLNSLLFAERVFLWADLDLAALSIFRSLKSGIPQLKFSALYDVMMAMAQNSSKSHPYAALFEKDGQVSSAGAGFASSDLVANRIFESCRSRAVDQEAVDEADILRLGGEALG